jgi:hypothetical protein
VVDALREAKNAERALSYTDTRSTLKPFDMWDFFAENWTEILLAVITLLGTFTALTESKKDDTILDIFRRIVNAVVLGRNK